jgi:hypothetical protein
MAAVGAESEQLAVAAAITAIATKCAVRMSYLLRVLPDRIVNPT